jgi:hypothetical protein
MTKSEIVKLIPQLKEENETNLSYFNLSFSKRDIYVDLNLLKDSSYSGSNFDKKNEMISIRCLMY